MPEKAWRCLFSVIYLDSCSTYILQLVSNIYRDFPMSKTVTVQARIEPKLKKQAESVIKQLGLTASQVVNALYAQIALNRGIPFDLKLPNKTTLAAMKELETGHCKSYRSVDEMFNDLD